jgi:hypothetical protein
VEFTGHVPTPTAIKIAFLPSFAVNSIPALTPSGGNRDFGPSGLDAEQSSYGTRC